MSTAQLAADVLTRRFGDDLAVDEVSFAVAPGEVVGLLGANGAGKTTTIRMLLGLLRPTSGTAWLMGGPPSRTTRRALGYVPQSLGLYAELTVEENVAFAAQAYRATPAALPDALTGHRGRLVGQLPLGLQRQLAFLCALQHRPAVLVLDEPTSGVEPLARARLWDTIREQADGGVGVLVTTHYMQEARQCDRLLLMSRGRLVGEGSEAAIVSGTTVVAVRTDDWVRTFTVLSDAGLPVTLAGRTVRVVDGDPAAVADLLGAHDVSASLQVVPASIEERMASLAAAGRAS